MYFRNSVFSFFAVTIVMVVMHGCVDPFALPDSKTNHSYLVVDGYLNSGADSSVITLSRSQPLDSPDELVPELGAQVQAEDENGNFYQMLPKSDGRYMLAPMTIVKGKKFKLHISTGSQLYESAFVEASSTPPIDSITWSYTKNQVDKGININVNAHDPANQTTFYRWTYEATWKYSAAFRSSLIRLSYPKDTIVYRAELDDISKCYISKPSTNILLFSTSDLSQDVVSQFPIAFIPQLSPMISYRYSILVHQYGITSDEFAYWQKIQKNTENIGTVFGPLPSQTSGNIICTSDPNEPVIGYFSVTQAQSTRFFVDANEFPTVRSFDDVYASCATYMIDVDQAYYPTNDLYIYPVFEQRTLVGYMMGSQFCSDCRLTGGSLTAPSFW